MSTQSGSRNAGLMSLPAGHQRTTSVPRTTQELEISEPNAPWKLKNVLSFDGGGMRGYYSLLFLRILMEYVQDYEHHFVDGNGVSAPASSSFHPHNEPVHVSHNQPPVRNNFLPCHYFDYICGTSTGGLIAIMLSRLRMSVEDCIFEYARLGSQVFGSPRIIHSISLPFVVHKRTKYDTNELEAALEDVISRRGRNEGPNRIAFKNENESFCKTFVCAFKQSRDRRANQPWLFRSYDHLHKNVSGDADVPQSFRRNLGEASSFPILMVALATTAAPLYFKPLRAYDDQRHRPPTRRGTNGARVEPQATYIDGGFGEQNNPSKEAYYEVLTSNEHIGTFVSIGTGRKNPDRFRVGLINRVKAAFDVSGDTEQAHEFMIGKSDRERFPYFRFTEPEVLADMDFDDWKPRKNGRRSMDRMERAFSNWAVKPNVQRQLRQCANQLVRRRRLRLAADPSHWESFALGSRYDCGRAGCPEPVDKRWYRRSAFEGHLRQHHLGEGEIDERILQDQADRHQSIWEYKPPA